MTAALKSLKEDIESRAADLRAKIAQAHGLAERYQRRLDQLYRESEAKVQELTRSFLSIPAASTGGETNRVRRTRRWSLDGPVLTLIRSMRTPIITAPAVWVRWNQEHPDQAVERSTIRGVLERLEKDGELMPVEDGRRGRTNVRTYRVPEVIMEGSVKEEITAH